MYTSYFAFREKPFSLSPDPRFLYLSGSHREVLGHLVYGIEQREGFMAITGEVGTGKTTLCRTLLRRLGTETEVAFIFNPTLTPLELLRAVNAEFGLSTFGDSRPELTDVLNTFLLEQSSLERQALLIVDEAQNLSTETLEQLRLLSNLETETSKLLQIILIGQPELDQKLRAKDLRQLRQRISVWWHLGPLDSGETSEYVRHRLRVAGALERPIFTDGALRTVHQLSRGVPRVINLLCDRALLTGYAEQSAQIGRRLVLRAAMELRPTRPRFAWLRARLGVGAAAVLLLGGALAALAPLAFEGSSEASARAGLAPETASAGPAPETAAAGPAAVARAKPAGERAPVVTVDAPLEGVLTRHTPAESHAATLEAALAAWQLPASGVRELGRDELHAWLDSSHLELLRVAPELPALLRASAPLIVSLRDARGVPRSALLRTLTPDHAHLEGLLPAETLRISTGEFLRHLDGEVYALWRDFEDLPPVLAEGDSGAGVVWVQQALTELGFYAAEIHGRFDEDTRAAVSLFQWDRDVPTDGEVGPRTLMHLYGALPRYATPTLAPEPVDLAHAS